MESFRVFLGSVPFLQGQLLYPTIQFQSSWEDPVNRNLAFCPEYGVLDAPKSNKTPYLYTYHVIEWLKSKVRTIY